jgi:hypothetical protein
MLADAGFDQVTRHEATGDPMDTLHATTKPAG